MGETIKIKLEIANRLYPLTINQEQEESLRDSALKINQMIKKFENNYEVRDKQDVLAMCSLHFASIANKNIKEVNNSSSEDDEKILELIDLIDVHLKTY
ncbi:MAG: cell division protein ZapA [Flavobacteriaceae bacterium]|nr:cell division protein ZapA [Flavobacteriaceae bacterium]|tara:strand:+ start:1546 stop:1842 length:297 start_codon:yes stop_codon:yes gene_type:complete